MGRAFSTCPTFYNQCSPIKFFCLFVLAFPQTLSDIRAADPNRVNQLTAPKHEKTKSSTDNSPHWGSRAQRGSRRLPRRSSVDPLRRRRGVTHGRTRPPPHCRENLGAAIQAEIDHSTSLWALKDLAPRWRPSMTDPLSAPHAMYGSYTTAAHGITKCAIRLADMLVDAGVPIPPLAAKPDDRSELATWVADVRALGVG